MSFFKTSVSMPMFTMRLSRMFDNTSRLLREPAYQIDQSTMAGQKIYQAITNHIDGVVAFAMQFSIRNHMKPQEADVVCESLHMHTRIVTGGEEEYYWKRFGDIPKDRGVFARVQIEYTMVGNSFLHLSGGKTGVQELDDKIRKFGADTFVRVCEGTKKEIKSIRLYP